MKNGVVYFSKCRTSGIFVSTTGVRITPIFPPTKITLVAKLINLLSNLFEI